METILLASFTAVESAHAFSAFLPSIFTIKTFAEGKEKDVRQGYIPAVIFGLALGFIISKLTKNWLPLYFSIGTIIFMVIAYEWALRS